VARFYHRCCSGRAIHELGGAMQVTRDGALAVPACGPSDHDTAVSKMLYGYGECGA
jgi:hypothetical protein